MTSDVDFVLRDLEKQYFAPLTSKNSPTISIQNIHGPQAKFTSDMMALIAMIPQVIFGCEDYSFKSSMNDNGSVQFKFVTDHNSPDNAFTQSCIDILQDEFAALSESYLKTQWNDETQELYSDDPEYLFALIKETVEEMKSYNALMAQNILSSATSILEKNHLPDKENSPMSEGVMAIDRALKTIIHSFPNTQDFELILSSNDIEGIEPSVCFALSLGCNSDISFEERYRTLQFLFDEFESRESISNNFTVFMWDCGTGFYIDFENAIDAYYPLNSMYRDFELEDRAKQKEIPFYINDTELRLAVSNKPTAKLKFKPYQH